MEDASGTDHVRCGEGTGRVFRPRGRLVVEGESGRNELLRGPFALFGVRNSAKLVRDLAKHWRTPMSPPQLIPPPSPGQGIAGDGRLRRRFSHTGHGPFRTLIVSNLKWLSSPAAPNHDNLPPGRKTHIHTPPSRPLACGGVLTCLTKSPSHCFALPK